SRLTIIGRSHIEGTNLNTLFQPLGGGGHSQAVAVNLRDVNPGVILEQLIEQLKAQIPHPLTARELMSSPVRTIRPDTTIAEAQRILLRYGHSGLSVVDETDQLVGIISRRDIDLALHHGFGHAPVKGYMSRNLKTITPETSLPEIESLMVTYDIGRLPVLDDGQLVGIVTRTDILRQWHQKGSGEWGV
ncbi:MAG TPA: poly(A) polymerase, partial [Cyanobacteria bacterium UBA11148]|nr:poly(A) polymerase [Cyanobacteria bacterium UBA11148]